MGASGPLPERTLDLTKEVCCRNCYTSEADQEVDTNPLWVATGMSDAKVDHKSGDKLSVNSCCENGLSKVDQALFQLSRLEQTLKTITPHKAKTHEAIKALLDAMKEIDESATHFDSLLDKERPQVPCKLLEWLDDGKDPDAFYKHFIDDAIWGSQVMQGKISAITDGQIRLRRELESLRQDGT